MCRIQVCQELQVTGYSDIPPADTFPPGFFLPQRLRTQPRWWCRTAKQVILPPDACAGIGPRRRIPAFLLEFGGPRLRCGSCSRLLWALADCSLRLSAAQVAGWSKMRFLLLLLVAASALVRSDASANLGSVPSKRLKMQYATGPLLKFQIW